MCVLADKNGELQRAKPDVELTDLEIVRVVHQLPSKKWQIAKVFFLIFRSYFGAFITAISTESKGNIFANFNCSHSYF